MSRRDPVHAFLERLDAALARNRVFVSDYARETAWSDFGSHEDDIFAVLYDLTAEDFDHEGTSTAPEGGDIRVFVPMTADGRLWVRLCERDDILVVSFHRG